jgi:hypothetical protein
MDGDRWIPQRWDLDPDIFPRLQLRFDMHECVLDESS